MHASYCISSHTHTHTHTHIYIYICIYIYTHTHIYTQADDIDELESYGDVQQLGDIQYASAVG